MKPFLFIIGTFIVAPTLVSTGGFLPASTAFAAPAALEEPAKSAFPLEAKSGGWTFRVEDAGFFSTSLERPDDPSVFLTPRFGVKAVTIAPDGTRAVPANYKMRLLSPSGAPLLQGEEVDPDWEWVWAEFSGRALPKQEQSEEELADGEARETLTFSLDRPLEAGTQKREARGVTPSGVEVELRDIKLTGENEISLQCRLSAPAARPDTRVVPLESADFELLDDNGNPLEIVGGNESYPSEGDLVEILRFKELPQGDEWKLRLGVSSIRRADALGDRISARIKVPVNAVARLPLKVLPSAPTAQNDQVSLQVESDSSVSDEWHGYVWTRDAGNNLGRVWIISEAWWLKPQGEPQQIWPNSGLRLRSFHGDGTRVLPNEWQTILSFPLDPKARPTSADLRFELSQATLILSSFSVEVPIPAPNTSVDMDEDVTTDSNAPWTLRKVVAFSPDAPLARQGEGFPKSGLALVFQESPFIRLAEPIEPDLVWAHDEQERPLDGGVARMWIAGDSTQKTDGQANQWTLVLSLPAPDAQTVSVGVKSTEWNDLDETTTLEVHDVPIAPAPPQ